MNVAFDHIAGRSFQPFEPVGDRQFLQEGEKMPVAFEAVMVKTLDPVLADVVRGQTPTEVIVLLDEIDLVPTGEIHACDKPA